MKFRFAGFVLWVLVITQLSPVKSQETNSLQITYNGIIYKLYPAIYEAKPVIPSPFTTEQGKDIVISTTKDGKYFLIPVTLRSELKDLKSTSADQLVIDTEDFPSLSKTGLHDESLLKQKRTITGRSVSEITSLGYPGGLSYEGFLAPDEDIISVLIGDNRIVKKFGLTHEKMAKPLFHVYNLIRDQYEFRNFLSYERHTAFYPHFLYNGKKIYMKVMFTRGGQQSIFDDGITGALDIEIWREPEQGEIEFIGRKYSHLKEEQLKELKNKLSRIHTGEMVPYYIKRYGFYEGHTGYRADPLAISFVFGLKSIEEIEKVFPGKIYEVFVTHFKR